MTQDLVCWKCGAALADLPQPLSRRAECPACEAELHVCRLCRHYDATKAKQCREPMAEEVKEKTRANFCEWFQPRPQAFQAGDTGAADSARGKLEALFGGEPSAAESRSPRDALDRIFGNTDRTGKS